MIKIITNKGKTMILVIIKKNSSFEKLIDKKSHIIKIIEA